MKALLRRIFRRRNNAPAYTAAETAKLSPILASQEAAQLLQAKVAEARAAIAQTNAKLSNIASKNFAPAVGVKVVSSVRISDIEKKLKKKLS